MRPKNLATARQLGLVIVLATVSLPAHAACNFPVSCDVSIGDYFHEEHAAAPQPTYLQRTMQDDQVYWSGVRNEDSQLDRDLEEDYHSPSHTTGPYFR